jgi:hypothetical protein
MSAVSALSASLGCSVSWVAQSHDVYLAGVALVSRRRQVLCKSHTLAEQTSDHRGPSCQHPDHLFSRPLHPSLGEGVAVIGSEVAKSAPAHVRQDVYHGRREKGVVDLRILHPGCRGQRHYHDKTTRRQEVGPSTSILLMVDRPVNFAARG